MSTFKILQASALDGTRPFFFFLMGLSIMPKTIGPSSSLLVAARRRHYVLTLQRLTKTVTYGQFIRQLMMSETTTESAATQRWSSAYQNCQGVLTFLAATQTEKDLETVGSTQAPPLRSIPFSFILV